MSYLGTREQAKADCKAADMQIDGNDTANTSPVRSGGSSMGAAPLSGTKEFTNTRTRHTDTVVKSMRREFPTEGVSGKS